AARLHPRPAGPVKVTLGPKLVLEGASQMPSATEQTLAEQAAQARLDKGAAVRAPQAGPLLGGGSGGGMLAGTSPSSTPPDPASGGGNPPAGMVPSRGSAMQMRPAQPVISPRAAAKPSKPLPGAVRSASAFTKPCMLATTGPTIASVSGKKAGVVFTPEVGQGPDPTNQYSIRGCNFGAKRGYVQIFGGFRNHGRPVPLVVDIWSDQLIVATFDPTFQDEYDTSGITLTVGVANGQTAELAGNTFYAARASRPLKLIPAKAETAPNPRPLYVKAQFLSPANSANFNASADHDISVLLPEAISQGWAAMVDHEADFPGSFPPSASTQHWTQRIDFRSLRPGFQLDPTVQIAALAFWPDNCNVPQATVAGRVQGSVLVLSESPALCQLGGNLAYAAYGLILSVTGPKGADLSPWPDGVR
ncbi:MAG: hypothetical protein ACRD1E_00100, partial [Terriglobales bacterium]